MAEINGKVGIRLVARSVLFFKTLAISAAEDAGNAVL